MMLGSLILIYVSLTTPKLGDKLFFGFLGVKLFCISIVGFLVALHIGKIYKREVKK